MKIDVSINDGSDFTVTVLLAGKESVSFEVKSIDGTQAVGWAAGNLKDDFSEPTKWPQVDTGYVFSTKEEEHRIRSVESALLGFMIAHPRDMGMKYALETLDVDGFKFVWHQYVFAAIWNLNHRGHTVNPGTVKAECDKITIGMKSGYWVPRRLIESLGGDLDPSMCFAEILNRRIADKKQ